MSTSKKWRLVALGAFRWHGARTRFANAIWRVPRGGRPDDRCATPPIPARRERRWPRPQSVLLRHCPSKTRDARRFTFHLFVVCCLLVIGNRESHIGNAGARPQKEDLLQSKIRSSHPVTGIYTVCMYSPCKYHQNYPRSQLVCQYT